MTHQEQVLFSERVVTDGRVAPAGVRVRDGIVVEVIPGTTARSVATTDLGALVLMPGIVDTHVHVNEPGRTEWEGFATASRAAAAGGTTTMVVMPLNCHPVVTTVDALQQEVAAARAACLIDYGFWGGVVPDNLNDLTDLWEAGVLGFKCFMVDSGIDEFPAVEPRELGAAMQILAGFAGHGTCTDATPPLLIHAEDPRVIADARRPSGLDEQPRSYLHYLASRPAESELRAIRTLIELCERHRTRTHVVHLATGEALAELRAARARGAPLTVETCPHYLAMCAEDIRDGDTLCKCAPPIRAGAEREALWAGLRDGHIDLIASDHSPCPPALKHLADGDFARAWGGIASLQLSLPIVWTQAVQRGFAPTDLARWMCESPARLAGLQSRKGRIAPGLNADLVAWDPEARFTVRAQDLEHRHKATPYDGRTLRGVVRRTYVRGEVVFDFDGNPPDASRWIRQEVGGRWLNRRELNPVSRS